MHLVETPEPEETQAPRYSSIEFLQSLEPPKVPEHLEPFLKVNWVGKKGFPAVSAIDAAKTETGEPKLIFSLIYKSSIIEDTFPHSEAEKEMKVFSETAEELCL
jgi:hypothetical protein